MPNLVTGLLFGLLGLWDTISKEKKRKFAVCNHRKLNPKTHSAHIVLKKIKEGKKFPYGCFLRTSAIIAITTTIATNRPAMAGMKYRSAADGDGVAIGVCVAAGASTANAVSDDDP
jgi:hypothetical protein